MKKAAACMTRCLCLLCVVAAMALPVHAAGEVPGDGVVEIWDREGLAAIAQNPAGQYRLMDNINMGQAHWVPIPFNGSMDGAGYTIYNLTIREADPQLTVSVDGNRKPYDTVFAALFSYCKDAVIQNLNLLGVDIVLETDQNAYAAGLVGHGENVHIENCSVSGRMALTMSGRMCGVAGIMGFGYGSITGCTANVELTLVDSNDTVNCEEFMGGILASGYADIENCTIDLQAYTSVHGYVHNGGVVGMYYVHTVDSQHAGYMRNNTVTATIRFFEDVRSRRAYCAPVIGEQMHWILEIAGNTVQSFASDESKDYSTPLLPEGCATPVYTDTVTQPGCDSFGYTTHSCSGCGYSYVNAYVAPAHTPGDWQVTTPAAPGRNGREEQCCTACDILLAEKDIIPASACTLSFNQIEMAPEETIALHAEIQPAEVSSLGCVFASSDDTVASVDATGVVTAHKAGQAIITCTTVDGFADTSCEVVVTSPFPTWALLVGGAAIVVVIGVAVAVLLMKSGSKRQGRGRRHLKL